MLISLHPISYASTNWLGSKGVYLLIFAFICGMDFGDPNIAFRSAHKRDFFLVSNLTCLHIIVNGVQIGWLWLDIGAGSP
jgi:hypothetical protein